VFVLLGHKLATTVHAQGCESMNDRVAASVARLEAQLAAGTLSYSVLDREIGSLEEIVRQGSGCTFMVPSKPRIPEAAAPSRRPSPEEMMERTLRTHHYRPTPEANSDQPPGTEKLTSFVARLKAARRQVPLGADAVRDALRAYR
jgi:hypothetical protein